MKHIIIGGGISGLYIAIQLLDKGEKDFLILEKNGYNKSKIFTIREPSKDLLLELGPSVFHSKQKKLLSLIERLGLSNDIEEISSKEKAYFIYKNYESEYTKNRWKELKDKVYNNNSIKKYETLKEASKRILTKEEYNILKTCWGEWYEVCDSNLNSLKNIKEGTYLKLKNGLDQIIERSVKLVKNIKYNCKVINISKIDNYYITKDDIGNEYISDKVYICGNLKAMKKISLNRELTFIKDYLNLAKSKKCMRLYVYFNKPIDIPYKFIIGDFIGKFSIRYSNNLWLISYPDDILALKLYNMKVKNIIRNWIAMINTHFNLSIKMNNVDSYYCSYWDDAYCILKKEYYKTNIDLKNIVVTSIPSIGNEAWMEGHLFKI